MVTQMHGQSGDRLSVCQSPHGSHEHVDVEGPAPETCFANCDCSPRLYVAFDAVMEVVAKHALTKYDAADIARRELIRKFVRGETR